MSRADRFLRACRGQPVDATPAWFMRQAGRYMPEYRALRAEHPILEMIKTPALAAEVTLQPIRAFEVDAAIIFADILQVLEEIGLDLRFVPGTGPVIDNPVRDAGAVASLVSESGRGGLDKTCEAIRLVTATLNGEVPLIGFCGAPFTLACYAIEGGSSRDYVAAKSFMAREPTAWDHLMQRLTDVLVDYLGRQVEAGAGALQLFDSWVGQLGPADFEQRVLPTLQALVERLQPLDVPIIYFGTGTAGLLPLIKEVGADVVGVDWRIGLADAWDRLGRQPVIMGNLDPFALFRPAEEWKREVSAILDQAAGMAGHIFNLGHGIHKETPVEQVRLLAEFVHESSR